MAAYTLFYLANSTRRHRTKFKLSLQNSHHRPKSSGHYVKMAWGEHNYDISVSHLTCQQWTPPTHSTITYHIIKLLPCHADFVHAGSLSGRGTWQPSTALKTSHTLTAGISHKTLSLSYAKCNFYCVGVIAHCPYTAPA